MLIRKNTKAFKSILEIITACQSRGDREKLVRLYITRAGHTVSDRLSVEGIQAESALFYEMNYQTVLNSLGSSHHQLHSSDEIPGIYFFRSATNKTWDENPFEFDPAIHDEFAALPELPLTRKKEKAQKVSLPTAIIKDGTKAQEKITHQAKREEKKLPDQEKKPDPPKKEKLKKTVEHHYKLRHEIEFTDLKRIVFRQANLTRKDILDYYYNVSEYLLPYLQQRSLSVVRTGELKKYSALTADLMQKDDEPLPKWVVPPGKKSQSADKSELHCNDTEQLMFYVENGCIQFNASHGKSKTNDLPDYIVIGIESPDHEIGKAVSVALTMNELLSALKLPSFVKLGDESTLQVYIPLDSKSDFSVARKSADYLCKLMRLKISKQVAIKDDGDDYGKVILDPSQNDAGKNIVAPYSLIAAHAPLVAAPLLWEELGDGINPDEFTTETIFKRLKKIGDPFSKLYKSRINADNLFERLVEHYAFLF